MKATCFGVTHIVSRGFKTPRTFGVPKGLALKALPKAFVLATVLERLPVSAYWLAGHSLAMAISQMVPVWGSQKVLAFLSSNIAASIILAMPNFRESARMPPQSVAAARWPNHGTTVGETRHLRSAPRELDSSFKRPSVKLLEPPQLYGKWA